MALFMILIVSLCVMGFMVLIKAFNNILLDKERYIIKLLSKIDRLETELEEFRIKN